jgi:hypothetical protein
MRTIKPLLELLSSPRGVRKAPQPNPRRDCRPARLHQPVVGKDVHLPRIIEFEKKKKIVRIIPTLDERLHNRVNVEIRKLNQLMPNVPNRRRNAKWRRLIIDRRMLRMALLRNLLAARVIKLLVHII